MNYVLKKERRGNTQRVLVFLLVVLMVISLVISNPVSSVKADSNYKYYGEIYIYQGGWAGFWAWQVFYYHVPKPHRVPPFGEISASLNTGIISDLQFWIGAKSYVVICDTSDGSLHTCELEVLKTSRNMVTLTYCGN